MYQTRGILETDPGLAWAIIIGFGLIAIIAIVSLWKIFVKANKPGWAAIVPIYNVIVMVQIAKKPGWWAAILLLGGIIPFVGPIVTLVFSIMLSLAIAEKFGKSQGFGIGLALLGFVFYPILAFGDAKYEGSSTNSNDEILDVH